MTREEMLDGLYHIKNWKCNGDAKMHKVVTEAIKALEQEPVLDKIRAEIDNINLNEVVAKYEDRFYGFQQEVLKILDKYKKSEE